MNRLLPSLLVATAAVSLAPAQRVIGLTQNIQTVAQQDMTSCQTASCTVGALLGGPSATPFAGGTAEDMRRGGVWISNGPRVAMVNARTCQVMCPPFAPAVGGEITGLGMHEPSGNIYALTTAGALYTIGATCPWTIITRCPLNTFLPPTYVAGGLAVDDDQGFIFIAAGDPAAPGTATLFVTHISNPCTVICRFPASRCGGNVMGTPTGAAWDPCKHVCYVTDGRQTTGIHIPNPANCNQFVFVSCCPQNNLNNDPFIGLCVHPIDSTSTGQPCANNACGGCAPVHNVSTVPYPGNPAFNLSVNNAAAGSLGYLGIGNGPCMSPGVPFACGQFHALPILTFVGPLGLGGGVGCSGSGNVSLAIPANYALCGITLSSQWIVLCGSSLTGISLSNCMSWTISGS